MDFKYFLTICFALVLVFIKLLMIDARFEFTNIKCNTLDETFCSFDYCYLKSVNRTYKYTSIKVKLHKIPVTKIKVNLALMQSFFGFQSFSFNTTFDVCKYLSNPNAADRVQKYLLGIFLPSTNINHSCPFDHDLVVEKLTIEYLNNQIINNLPVPPGDYAFYTNWFANGIKRADVKVYFTIS